MSSIIQRIDSLIHQEINPYSPANMTVFELYKSNPNEYERILKEQASKYKDKNIAYFK
jgi:ubiquitin-protein ligase